MFFTAYKIIYRNYLNNNYSRTWLQAAHHGGASFVSLVDEILAKRQIFINFFDGWGIIKAIVTMSRTIVFYIVIGLRYFNYSNILKECFWSLANFIQTVQGAMHLYRFLQIFCILVRFHMPFLNVLWKHSCVFNVTARAVLKKSNCFVFWAQHKANRRWKIFEEWSVSSE